MNKMYEIASAIFTSKIVIPKFLLYKSVRYFRGSIYLNVQTRIKINDYLLNRSVPASDILNSLTKEDQERLEEIKIEYQDCLASGFKVPSTLKDVDLLELLCLNFWQRKSYLTFLAKKQFSKENDAIKQMNKSCIRQVLQPKTDPVIVNKFVSKYYINAEKKVIKKRLFNGIVLNSQEIIFDFSYENEMDRRSVKELAKQFQYCFTINKQLKDPFQMVLTSLKQNSLTYCDLNYYMLGNRKEKSGYKTIKDFPVVVHEEHYCQAYSNRRLVYLSPDSKCKFQHGEYDHDAIYILGSIVDKGIKRPMTLFRARSEGLESRSLPLDDYVDWQNGFRGLPLNQVFNIISIARETSGNWSTAIRETIPNRFLFKKKY